jgi:hypothetical protein
MTIQEENISRGDCAVTHFEKPAEFGGAYPHAAPGLPTIKTLALSAALLAYAVGFLILCPIVAGSAPQNTANMSFLGR